MRRLLSATSRVVMLKVYLSSDHVSAATGKTIAITISKNGGAFGNPNAGATNATEVSSGWYKVTLDTTDTNTVGDLVVRGTSATCDDSEQTFDVVDSASLGASRLSGDAFARLGAPAGASVSADIAAVKTDTAAIKVTTDKFVFTVANMVDSNVIDWKGATAPAMTGDSFARLGAPVGASHSADVAAVKTVVDAVNAKTTNLPPDPADASDIAALFNAIPAGILDAAAGVETGWTVREALRVMLATLAGPTSGMGTFTVTIQNPAGSKNRIQGTVDVSGNRSAISYDKT